jgi:hypothetical protein
MSRDICVVGVEVGVVVGVTEGV